MTLIKEDSFTTIVSVIVNNKLMKSTFCLMVY